MAEIYLDNNATTAPLDAVVDEVAGCLGRNFGNPSSPHGRGNACRAILATARQRVAGLIGARPEQVIFTSGGTEANNAVLKSVLAGPEPKRLITTTIEHSSVLKTAAYLEQHGIDVTYLPVDSIGRISSGDLRAALTDFPALVSIQWANSETGVLQPIDEFGRICRAQGVPLHVDAAQAVGRIPIDLETLPVDFLTFTGHKLHGPQGTGVLYARDASALTPLLHGGDQEHDLRAGTENVPGIAGLGRAAEIRDTGLSEAIAHMQGLRDQFEKALLRRIDRPVVNGHWEERICNTSNLRFPSIEGQALMAQLDQRGILCSQTSACTSHRPEPSYTLLAMGLTEDEAYASVRFSFSIMNTSEEVDRAVEAIADIHRRLTRLGQLAG